MPVDSNPSARRIGIKLVNGQQWRFHPTDAGSAEAIRHMAEVMQLSPVASGEELFVTIRQGRHVKRCRIPGQKPLICILPPGTNDAMQIVQMMDIFKMIAAETLPCGGLLIHGALAERDGFGIILAAPANTGKTTASNRIPPPWRSRCDDATLVVRDNNGNYFAHPMPTWSRFFDQEPGGRWDVEREVPLAAVFFLSQSPEDHAEPLTAGEATAHLMESVHQIMDTLSSTGCTSRESESLCEMELAAVSALTGVIPAYILHISLIGRFWEEIDRVLQQQTTTLRAERKEKSASPAMQFPHIEVPDSSIEIFATGHIPIVYSGPSMNPTLGAPDLLDVFPYNGTKPAVGDIICFTSPGDEKNVVHRIIRISGSGIQTQGDNNPSPDPAPVQEDQIIGRVIGVRRGRHYRKIACGTFGRFTRWRRCIRKSVRTKADAIIRLGKPALVLTREIARFLLPRWKPRLVLFSSRKTRTLRLYFGSSVAGEFNTKRGTWTIRFPFQMLVDKTALPTVERPGHEHLQDIAHAPANSAL